MQVVLDEICRIHHRVEFELPQRCERGFFRVGGKSERAHLALVPGFHKCLHRPAGTEDRRHIRRSRHDMKLVEIEVIGLEASEGALKFQASAGGVTLPAV